MNSVQELVDDMEKVAKVHTWLTYKLLQKVTHV